MVTAALTRNPNYGEKMVHGLLASKGIKVQRQRLRQSLRRVDPQGENNNIVIDLIHTSGVCVHVSV